MGSIRHSGHGEGYLKGLQWKFLGSYWGVREGRLRENPPARGVATPRGVAVGVGMRGKEVSLSNGLARASLA